MLGIVLRRDCRSDWKLHNFLFMHRPSPQPVAQQQGATAGGTKSDVIMEWLRSNEHSLPAEMNEDFAHVPGRPITPERRSPDSTITM